MNVTVIRTGLSNLGSMVRALEECGAAVRVAEKAGDLDDAARVVLPGVGAFPEAMARLERDGFADALREHARRERPLLGVCLGMQLLADEGEEMGGAKGLGLVPGKVVALKVAEAGERLPHMGWNDVRPRGRSPLMRDTPDGGDFYFVHSYHFVPDDPADIAATTPYCGGFVSIVARGATFGAQFHPEKSSRAGARLLANFLAA
ncbi:MAG: imidazole glycerol phosphate synthase subunit HisH [Alphaproteobacteria bacterium]|nr:imidazole glycerol phosphate synthase subunit HisH [Alphaproteobacteria bacterium]